jgi:hypothetical protein
MSNREQQPAHWETALKQGRERGIALKKQRGEVTRAAVLRLAQDDEARGLPPWGRAVRVAQRLRGLVTERQVRRIILSVCPNWSGIMGPSK